MQKSVVRSPLIDMGHLTHILKPPFDTKDNVVGVLGFIIKPGVSSFCQMVLPKWCCTKKFCGIFAVTAVVATVVILGIVASEEGVINTW